MKSEDPNDPQNTHKHIDKFILETQAKHSMTGTVGDLRIVN